MCKHASDGTRCMHAHSTYSHAVAVDLEPADLAFKESVVGVDRPGDGGQPPPEEAHLSVFSAREHACA